MVEIPRAGTCIDEQTQDDVFQVGTEAPDQAFGPDQDKGVAARPRALDWVLALLRCEIETGRA